MLVVAVREAMDTNCCRDHRRGAGTESATRFTSVRGRFRPSGDRAELIAYDEMRQRAAARASCLTPGSAFRAKERRVRARSRVTGDRYVPLLGLEDDNRNDALGLLLVAVVIRPLLRHDRQLA